MQRPISKSHSVSRIGRPPKVDDKLIDVAKVVVCTLRDLKDPEGSSFAAIKNHIMKRQGPQNKAYSVKIMQALKKGIGFGAIKKENGRYRLDSEMTLTAKKGRSKRKARVRHQKKGKRAGRALSYASD